MVRALRATLAPAPKERGILFSAPMVRALLSGAKTQTRRRLNPQPAFSTGRCWYPRRPTTNPQRGLHYANEEHFRRGAPVDFSPYGQPGDRLWVRETWAAVYDCPDLPCCESGESVHRRPVYRATEPDGIADYACSFDCDHDEAGCAYWRPSLFMPRWASRLLLEVTDVRVERLQDITPADAVAEGVWSPDDRSLWNEAARLSGEFDPNGDPMFGAVDLFHALWESIHGAGSWDASPWVWVVGFRRLP
jgi:hypothetical protein